MAASIHTVLKIGGAAGKSVLDTFAGFQAQQKRARDPEAIRSGDHWTPHCRRRMDTFARSFRSHCSEVPVIFYVEYVDMWSGRDGPDFLPSWHKRAIVLYADEYSLACYALPDRDRLKRDMRNAFRRTFIRERSGEGQECRWALTICQEAVFAWNEMVDDSVLVWLRRIIGPSIKDAAVTEALSRVPTWCRGKKKGSLTSGWCRRSAAGTVVTLDRMSHLITAAKSGNKKAVERLLASGAEVNERDRIGNSALFEAVSSGHIEIVQLLLARGADPNLPENNGTTPVMEAASGGDIAMMRVLLRAGARVSAQDNFGDTALEYARAQKQHAAAKFLRRIT